MVCLTQALNHLRTTRLSPPHQIASGCVAPFSQPSAEPAPGGTGRRSGAAGLQSARVSAGGASAVRTALPAQLKASAAAAKGEVFRLITTIDTPEQLEQVLARFAEAQKAGKPAVLISGASVNGSMTAAKANSLGANVLVMEKRDGFSRNNIYGLKDEAVYTMAAVSPDGELLKSLHDAGHINFRKSRIEAGENGLKQLPAAEHRFADWVLPGEPGKGLPSMIPVLKAAPPALPRHLDLALPQGERGPRPQAEHLDLAEDTVIGATPAADWRYNDLGQLGNSSLVITQTRHLETGLNQFLARQDGVEIAKGTVDVKLGGDHYTPHLTMRDCTVVPGFRFDLVHVAEGTRGKNTLAHAERLGTDFGETWFQRNLHVEPDLNPGSSLVRNPQDPQNPGVIPIRFNRKGDTVINVAHLASRADKTAQVWKRNAPLTQEVLKAAGSQLRADDPALCSYDSGPIHVAWGRARAPAKKNLALGGDAAANKSPSAGAGASLAASAYPEMTQRLMEHPGFADPMQRDAANAAYNRQARQVSDVWEDKSIRLMRGLGRLPDEALADIRAKSGREATLKGED